MPLVICGAGMAGLLAARMLSDYDPIVVEAQKELPNNHSALLRFRTQAVEHVTGIKFKQVRVHKAVVSGNGRVFGTPTLADQNAYSIKVIGKISERSIGSTQSGERYIAPPDFISRLAKGLDIKFDTRVTRSNYSGAGMDARISTIPMPEMIMIAGIDGLGVTDDFNFEHVPIATINVKLKQALAYQTFYFPHNYTVGTRNFNEQFSRVYRASLTGDLLTIEAIGKNPIDSKMIAMIVNEVVGIMIGEKSPWLSGNSDWADNIKQIDATIKYQTYGKIIDIDPAYRKKVILELTKRHNIYSLGRFATWRQLLLDDVVNDVSVIRRLMEGGSMYDHHLHVNS